MRPSSWTPTATTSRRSARIHRDRASVSALSPAGDGSAWTFLLTAGILEIVWAIAMKYSAGFTRVGAAAVTIVAALASFYFLSRALKTLPVGTAYAVWT